MVVFNHNFLTSMMAASLFIAQVASLQLHFAYINLHSVGNLTLLLNKN